MFRPGIVAIFRNVFFEVYRMSQEEWTKLRERVPYVELYGYNPKHLYPKFTVTEIMAREV